jgi:hypothetical protein
VAPGVTERKSLGVVVVGLSGGESKLDGRSVAL